MRSWRSIAESASARRHLRRRHDQPSGEAPHEAIHHRAEIPGASELTQEQLAEISKTSNAAVASLGVPYNWVTSYVAGDKVYCVHEAEDAEVIREHARRGGFPANM